jgi:hypothetical protein
MHYLPRKFPRTMLAGFVALIGAGLAPAVATIVGSALGPGAGESPLPALAQPRYVR